MLRKMHHQLYLAALAAAEKETDMEEKDVHVCPVCGVTFEGEVPDTCPVCNAKKESFVKIE